MTKTVSKPVSNRDRTHVPLRTCVGCRKRAAKSELVRIAYAASANNQGDGDTSDSDKTSNGSKPRGDRPSLVVDSKKVMPGRGAYVHNTTVCVSRALERGGLARSFRRRVRVPSEEMFLRDRGVAEAAVTEKEGQS